MTPAGTTVRDGANSKVEVEVERKSENFPRPLHNNNDITTSGSLEKNKLPK